jgi:HK97 family phage major capsid protein
VLAGFIMQSPNQLAGYPAAVTTALPGVGTGTLIFGSWSQLLVAYWSGFDLLINPYSENAYRRGRVLVRVMRDCDVAVRHAEAFAFSDDLSVAGPQS